MNKIWTFENNIHFKTLKAYIFFGLRFFKKKFCIYVTFVLIYHILSYYKGICMLK
jgi:hypothetical protein